MSALNESLVLDYVREHDGSSRSTVAGGLGLSAATVSRIVSRLTRTGLITVEPQVATGRGRPAARLRFNRRAGCVLAVDLGGTKCHGVLADLSGEILVEDVRPTDSDGSPYDTLLAVISDLSDTAPSPVAAAAVGVPAIVDPETGFVLGGPNVTTKMLAIPYRERNSARVRRWRGAGVAVAASCDPGAGWGSSDEREMPYPCGGLTNRP